MRERYSPQRAVDVRKQSQSQYEHVWNGYADARRALYPYEVPPGEDREPYNIWSDIATRLNPGSVSKIVEFGTNDGYFHSILRHAGFKGEFVGIDIQGSDLPAIEHIARQRFPMAEVSFLEGDAQDLRNIFPDSSVPAAAANFVTYHAEKPSLILSELHRILEPGGRGVVSSRNTTNQKDTWEVTRWVAHSHGFAFPQELSPEGKFIPRVPISRISVYSHFDIDQTRRSLSQSKKFKIIDEYVQDTDLYIPTDDEVGLHNLELAVESLVPYTVRMTDQRKPNQDDILSMYNFILQHMRHFFIVSGEKNKQELGLPRPYYISHATQGFFVVEAIK